MARFGAGETLARLQACVSGAIASIPACPRASELEALIRSEARRLVPKDIALTAA